MGGLRHSTAVRGALAMTLHDAVRHFHWDATHDYRKRDMANGRWYGTNYTISLDSVVTGNEVIGFRRWGFNGAQPVFCTDGFLFDASGLLTPDTAPDRKRITGIEHPDARAFAHSWQDVEDLIAEVDRLRALIWEKA
jgi:hypothetical protein